MNMNSRASNDRTDPGPSPNSWRLRDIRRWMSRHQRGMATPMLAQWESGIRLIDALIARFGPDAIWQYPNHRFPTVAPLKRRINGLTSFQSIC